MLTRVFLAAGVAALAIAAPATGGPRDGDKERGAQRAERSQVRAERQQVRAERQQVRVERAQRADRQEVRLERRAARAERPARIERQQARLERREARSERPARIERQRMRVERRELRAERPARIERQKVRIERQKVRVERAENRIARQQDRMERMARAQERALDRRGLRVDRIDERRLEGFANNGVGYGVGGCPPGLQPKGCIPPGQVGKTALSVITANNAAALRAARVDDLNRRLGVQLLAPTVATSLIGAPLALASDRIELMAVPQTVRYLYPDTDDYYYRYGGGYVYRVDRDDNLISALLPLLAGGLMPGTYLPTSYMNNPVPDYYGFNTFYPNSPYDCYRYGDGVVFEIDCATGLIEDVIPLYAGGYGVGQMLPASYSYYNLPTQYRSLYYDDDDYGYWYAPGAIYQYDRDTSLITSLAALLAPGLTIGQPLPAGYSVYNVPYSYRQTYYDTPTAMYRYNNGNIYQIDPTTMLVTAIVASILT